MMKRFKKLFILILCIFTLLLCSCDYNSGSINGECEIIYIYENQQVLLEDFELSDIKLQISSAEETYYINVTEDMISDTDLENLKKVGTHSIAIGYKDFIGFVTVKLVDEITEDVITYQIINPYENKEVLLDVFDLSEIKIEININGETSYINLNETHLNSTDLEKLKSVGNHTIKFTYENKELSFNIKLIEKANDGYTYDLENTKSQLKVSDLNTVYEDQEYSNYLDVASYIYHFHKLPKNYLTKSKAESLGWNGSGSNVWQNDALYGKLIGGDTFYNNEGNLPEVKGYAYVEVDVNCNGGNRGRYRLVYNKTTWDIYYTKNHYDSFVYLIGVLK